MRVVKWWRYSRELWDRALKQPAKSVRRYFLLMMVEVCFFISFTVTNVVKRRMSDIVRHWSTPQGGLVVFNYGNSESIGSTDEIAEIMFSDRLRVFPETSNEYK